MQFTPEFFTSAMVLVTGLVYYGLFRFVSLMTPGIKWYWVTGASVTCSLLFATTAWLYVLILSDIPIDIALGLCVIVSFFPFVITYSILWWMGTYRVIIVSMVIGMLSFTLLIAWAYTIDAAFYPPINDVEWIVESSNLV